MPMMREVRVARRPAPRGTGRRDSCERLQTRTSSQGKTASQVASVPSADAAGADDREHARVGACEPLRRDRGGGARAHQRVVRAVADREREPGLRVRVDEDREDGRQVVAGVVLADRDPLAGRGLRLLDLGGHDLPLALVAVEHDVALGLHVDAPRPCMRKACSTQSTYSAGVSSPIMSERPRISVLRWRQLSTARFYVSRSTRSMSAARSTSSDGEVRRQPAARALQLTAGPIRVPGLMPVSRRCEAVAGLGRAFPVSGVADEKSSSATRRGDVLARPASARPPRGRPAPEPRAAATPRPRPEILESRRPGRRVRACDRILPPVTRIRF